MFEKIKDFVMGKPKEHVIPPKLNRKQKRQRQHQLRKQYVAAKRHKHEGR